MSEGTEVEAGQEEDKGAAAAKRKTLSLRDRIKVIDHLRAQAEPIIADSNAALAVMVSNATGVDINWAQLKYMIDELPDMNLNSKVHVKSMLSGEDELHDSSSIVVGSLNVKRRGDLRSCRGGRQKEIWVNHDSQPFCLLRNQRV